MDTYDTKIIIYIYIINVLFIDIYNIIRYLREDCSRQREKQELRGHCIQN